MQVHFLAFVIGFESSLTGSSGSRWGSGTISFRLTFEIVDALCNGFPGLFQGCGDDFSDFLGFGYG